MLVRSLRNRGLGSTLRTIRVYAGGALFDLRYGVRTNRWVHRTDLEVVGNNKDNAIEYQPIRVLVFRDAFNSFQIQPDNAIEYQPIRVLVFRDAFNSFQIQPDGVFVDFGSGKGRALLLAILYGFHRVVGVEFAQNLCSVAEHNLNGFRDRTRRQFEADVVNVDAAFYPVNDDDCVFFFNNPFDSTVLEQVLSNIRLSLQSKHRLIHIVYAEPKHRQVLDDDPFWRTVGETTFGGYQTVVYDQAH